MNQVGEKIDKLKVGKRSFNPQELYSSLKGLQTVWCWGVHNWVGYKDMFLKFNVQGYLFKGHVYITLGWDDTFTLHFTTTHGTVKHVKEGIYVDVLVDTIDKIVERK